MYAHLCYAICNHPKAPKFPSPESNKPIDFRRLLLNKCQEEFEKGTLAMQAVKDREAADHKKEEVRAGQWQLINGIGRGMVVGCIVLLLGESTCRPGGRG